MARQRSPARDEAKKLYLDSNGTMKLVDIAANLNIKDSQVRKWKSQDNWDNELDTNSKGALPNSNSSVTNESVPLKGKISWIDIENEYVTDIDKKPCTLENLSQKYNIALQTVFDYSANNNWREKRRKYKESAKKKVAEKTIDIISNDIAKYQAKHLNISDKILNEVSKALDNPKELYTVVEKLRQGYGQGEFKESIETEVLDVINDSKVVNLVNSLEKLQKIQRQTLGILDEKDKIRLGKIEEISDYEKEKQELELENKKLVNRKLSAEISKINGPTDDEVQDDGFIEALEGKAQEDWIDDKEET